MGTWYFLPAFQCKCIWKRGVVSYKGGWVRGRIDVLCFNSDLVLPVNLIVALYCVKRQTGIS